MQYLGIGNEGPTPQLAGKPDEELSERTRKKETVKNHRHHHLKPINLARQLSQTLATATYIVIAGTFLLYDTFLF